MATGVGGAGARGLGENARGGAQMAIVISERRGRRRSNAKKDAPSSGSGAPIDEARHPTSAFKIRGRAIRSSALHHKSRPNMRNDPHPAGNRIQQPTPVERDARFTSPGVRQLPNVTLEPEEIARGGVFVVDAALPTGRAADATAAVALLSASATRTLPARSRGEAKIQCVDRSALLSARWGS
jgi:hypothetical protein